jgi:hypothetical protein
VPFFVFIDVDSVKPMDGAMAEAQGGEVSALASRWPRSTPPAPIRWPNRLPSREMPGVQLLAASS